MGGTYPTGMHSCLIMQLILAGRVRFQLVREDDEYGYLCFQKLHKKRHRWNSTAIQICTVSDY